MTDWETFCLGVLEHEWLSAPVNDTNVDTLWAWSNAETAPYPLMRWWNPMNSTEPWAGARDSGAQPGLHDVKIYASLQDGINATAYTLTQEPYYTAICANLRASLPRQQWGATSTAGAELHAWGTGTAWLTTAPYFGPAPTGLGGDDLLADERQWLYNTQANVGKLLNDPTVGIPAVLAAIKALPVSAGGLTPTQVAQLTQIVADAHIAAGAVPDMEAIKARIEKDLAA